MRPIAVAFAYGALAYVCLAFTRFGASVESIWLSNALLTAALIASPIRNWPEVIVGAAAGHIAAHLAVDDDFWFSVAALAGDMAEALVCAALLLRRPAALAFQSRADAIYFFVVSIVSVAFSTLVVALSTWAVGAPLGDRDLLVWFSVDALGMFVFLPIFHGFADHHWQAARQRPGRLIVVLLMVFVLAVLGAWFQHPVPRLVLLPVFVFMAFEFGVAGLALGHVVLLLTWTSFAVAGRSPGVFFGDDLRTYLLLAQGYVAAVATTMVTLAVVLDERARMSQRLARAAQDEAAKIEAEKANAFKSRLIAMASHDLRQPLMAAQTYLGVLEDRLADPQQREISKNAGHALDSMTNILDSLLDVSRLDAGIIAPRRSDFAVRDLLERIAASNRPQAEAKGLEIIVRCGECRVHSDPSLLERVIDNFATNAVRYTERGSVTLWCESRDGRALVGVTDTGIGIPSEAIETIFADYVQLNNPDRDRSRGWARDQPLRSRRRSPQIERPRSARGLQVV